MTLSAPIVEGMLSGVTDEGLLALVTITHPSLAAPLYLTPNPVDVVSRGNTYTAVPLDMTLPSDEEGRVMSAQIMIADPSRQLTAVLRGITSEAPRLLLELVRLADLDDVNLSYENLEIVEPSWQPPHPVITSPVKGRSRLERRYPRGIFNPGNWQGLPWS